MWYSNGVNVEQDQARALALHRRNAAVGYEASMYNAGWHYLIGVGTEKDNKQAAHYFGMAAERGSIEGAINLAGMQRDGLGFKKSDESAIATLKHFSDRIPELTELVAKMEKGDSLEEATITEGIPPQGPRKS
jgi:TPR repeat protein